MSRVLKCDYKGYEHVKAYLPDEWLGKHAILRDQTMQAAQQQYPDNAMFINICIALALVEKIEGVTGLEGDPKEWDLEQVPLAVLNWLEDVVLGDFLAVFESKKPFLAPSMKALQDLIAGIQPLGSQRKAN